MDFNTYLDQAWTDHATDSAKVANSLHEDVALIQTNDDIGQMAHLANHVCGVHLGNWAQGLTFLTELRQHPKLEKDSDTAKSIERFMDCLTLSSGKEIPSSKNSISDQIRILALSASALGIQEQAEKAKTLLLKAIELADANSTKEDPAMRTLAVAGNTLASSLEEKQALNELETDLMIFAAKVGRKYWEIAGTWKEVERAEYRLSHTFLKAKMHDDSFNHAQTCVEICETNSAPALEFFYGYECLALIEKAKNNQVGYETAVKQLKKYFDQLADSDKTWCQATLKKFN